MMEIYKSGLPMRLMRAEILVLLGILKWFSVSTLLAHPAVVETWAGLSQLCPEPGGSPWKSPHCPGQRFEGRIWGDWTCHMYRKDTVVEGLFTLKCGQVVIALYSLAISLFNIFCILHICVPYHRLDCGSVLAVAMRVRRTMEQASSWSIWLSR